MPVIAGVQCWACFTRVCALLLIGFCGSETWSPFNSSKVGTRISTFFFFFGSVLGQLNVTNMPIPKQTRLKENRKEEKEWERKGEGGKDRGGKMKTTEMCLIFQGQQVWQYLPLSTFTCYVLCACVCSWVRERRGKKRREWVQLACILIATSFASPGIFKLVLLNPSLTPHPLLTPKH